MGRMYSVLRYSCTRVQNVRYSYFTRFVKAWYPMPRSIPTFFIKENIYCILYLFALNDINIVNAFWFYLTSYLYSYSSTCACTRTWANVPWANVVLILGLILINSHGPRTRVQSCILGPCLSLSKYFSLS